jgi:histidinol-phosphate phosphatase family protein
MDKIRAVFLDRDGTLIRAYGGRPANTADEVELLPTVADGMVVLAAQLLVPIVVTNQGGIGLGFISIEDFSEQTDRLNDLLVEACGVRVAATYLCPHRPDFGCECRKPKPGMILDAARDLNIDLGRSYMVGDSETDSLAAEAAGIPKLNRKKVRSDLSPLEHSYFPNFLAAALAVADQEKKS